VGARNSGGRTRLQYAPAVILYLSSTMFFCWWREPHLRFVIYGYWVVAPIAISPPGQSCRSPGSFHWSRAAWGLQIMSVPVSAAQLRILVAAIAVVAVGQLVVASIGGGRAASRRSDQPLTRFDADGPSRASSCTPFRSDGTRPAVGRACKDAPPLAPSVVALEDEEMLRPRRVNNLSGRLLFQQNLVDTGDLR
jgi:hypothetical protein